MRYLVVILMAATLNGCALTDNFVKMDERVTGATEFATIEGWKHCVKPEDRELLDKIIQLTAETP